MPIYDRSNSGLENSYSEGDKYMFWVVKLVKKHLGITITPYLTKEEQYNIGESVEGYEVKLDNLCTQTYRLSIEFEERVSERHNWVDSGIFRNDNAIYYVQGNYDSVWIFKKKKLQEAFKKKKKFGGDFFERDCKPTVNTFYIPIPIADLLAIKKLERRKDENN